MSLKRIEKLQERRSQKRELRRQIKIELLISDHKVIYTLTS